MFDEPDEPPAETSQDPKRRAQEKFDELRMHAELAAVFEGPRKFAAELRPGLDADVARDVQRAMAKLERARLPDVPVVSPELAADAVAVLGMPQTRGLSTNDYHIHRRPGEVMIVRWLAGPQVQQFYERFQAHFDAALRGYREDERQAQGWKGDAGANAYLDALDAIDAKMEDRYLRAVLRQHNLFVLSTQAADEMDILYLCDHLMSRPPAEVVGAASAPPEDGATEQDRAWFFKLFSLRGLINGEEWLCFFTFMQKTDEDAW